MLKIEVLQEKPWYLQLAALCGVALVIYAGFWYFLTKGIRDETSAIETQVAQLQSSNAGAQIASQRLNEFRANYARAQADYEDLKALLPEQREITMVLQNIQDRARGHLTVRRFTPKDEVQQDFYTGKPIEVEVTGSYNDVGQFFAQLASYQRIVSITDFKLSKLAGVGQAQDTKEGKTVNAQFLLTAYYVSPEKLQPAAPAPAGQPAAAAAQPAAPSANPTQAAGQASNAASNAATATGK